MPDIVPKLKFIFEEAALEDLIAVKELLQQGALLNKQETSFATAQRAVDIIVSLGVDEENFGASDLEVNQRAKCKWASMFDLQPAADLNHDPIEALDHNADLDPCGDLNQEIPDHSGDLYQPPDLGFDLFSSDIGMASFEVEKEKLVYGAEGHGTEGATFSAYTGRDSFEVEQERVEHGADGYE